MKKYIKNIIILAILLIMLLGTFFSISKATSTYQAEMSSLITSANSGTLATDTTGTKEKISDIMGVILVTVRIIGITVAVTLLLVIAMKYMMAAPGEKADIKKSATVYIVGAVVLFAATGLLSIISTFAGKIG